MSENGNKNSKMKFAAGYGLALGLLLAALNFIEFLTKFDFAILFVFIYIGGIVYSTMQYRNTTDSFTYGQSLGFGIILSGFVFIILGFYNYIDIAFINVEEHAKKMDEMITLLKQSNFPFDTNQFKLIQNPAVVVVSSLISGIFAGLFVSLITSIFTKKD